MKKSRKLATLGPVLPCLCFTTTKYCFDDESKEVQRKFHESLYQPNTMGTGQIYQPI